MTHNPTQAEVQAAYDGAVHMIERKHFPLTDDVNVLLAAVKRDTLGWREVSEQEYLNYMGAFRFQVENEDCPSYWIKDAPT